MTRYLQKEQSATPPERPKNALHEASETVNSVVGLPGVGLNLLNEGFAKATHSIAKLFPAFPAATLGSLAMGIPHAHPAHPPSGPPPVPPTPLPPIGPVMFGTCVSVLINGMPAARCGDLGINPTCCGLPPFFEVFTGSSNVFIGGGRAARLSDITFHCKPVPPAGAASRGLATAMRVASIAFTVAGNAAQVADIGGDALEAVEADAADNAQLAEEMGLSAAMKAAQMANDLVAMAIGMTMGKDPCLPPGTIGAITLGSPNVLIGGFPMPSWMNVAKGLMKLVKGLRPKKKSDQGRSNPGKSHTK
jgi:uncharacterized Zn-binding protein involved in type VI secretion